MAVGLNVTSAITGTANINANVNVPGSYYATGSGLSAAIQTIWSKEIL